MTIFDKFTKWGPGRDLDQNGKSSELASDEGDPLHDWHVEQKQVSKSLEMTEDDWLLIENDPEFKKTQDKLGNISTEQGLDSWIESDKNDDTPEELLSTYSNEIHPDDLPFEEQDITQTWKSSKSSQEKEVQKEKTFAQQVEDRPLYSQEDFILMREAAELLFEAQKNKKSPVMPYYSDGTRMDYKETQQLAKEYLEFKKNNPEMYAEMKASLGEWKKAQPIWSHRIHNGKDQWSIKQGNDVIISNTNPENYRIFNGEQYFSEISNLPSNSKRPLSLSWVELQMPKKL